MDLLKKLCEGGILKQVIAVPCGKGQYKINELQGTEKKGVIEV